MRRLLRRKVLGLIVMGWMVAGPGQAASTARDGHWAQETSDIAPHPDVRWGRLANGFRYALLPHAGVPQAATMQLLVLAGSLDETDQERGVAHFIEHMCFRGNTEFSEAQMVAFFQELGTEYGSDINAITTFDHTAYSLDFRDASPELLDRGLRLFRSFADGVTFDPAAIEHERKVVLSELRSRENLQSKETMASLQSAFDGLRFPDRAPGGSKASVAALRPEQLVRFYRRNYRPDVMVLVAAGDFSADELEAMVRARFESLAPPATPLPERPLGTLVDSKAVRAAIYRITDIGSINATIAVVDTLPNAPDSRAARADRQREGLVQALLSQRLARGLFDTPGGNAGTEVMLGNRSVMASVVTNGEQWADHLGALDQMIRATARDGFDASELKPQREQQLRMIELMIGQVSHFDPHVVSQKLLDSIVDGQVYVGVAQELAWMRDWLTTTTLEQLNETFRRLWTLDRVVLQLTGDVPTGLKTGEMIEALLKERKVAPRAVQLAMRKEYKFELKDWGTPAKAELVQEVPECGAHLYRLGNGVRLNLVPTPFEPGVVRAAVRVGPGLLDMPGNKPALKEFGLQTVFASGTTHYQAEALGRIIDDRFLEFGFDVNDPDAFTFRGVTDRAELASFLGVVTEFLYKPKFGTYVHRAEFQKATLNRMSSAMGMSEGMRDLTDYLFKGDARFTWGSFVDYLGLSSVDVRHWLEKPLTQGYVEVTIVGDFDLAETVQAVERTLGELGPREETKSTRVPPKPVRISAPPGFKRIEFVGERHLAAVIGNWPVEGPVSGRDQAALYLLAKILELHVRAQIRNDLGLAYGPTAAFDSYDGFPAFGLVHAMIDCAADETSRIARLVEDIAADLAQHGVEAGELAGARGILASQFRRAWLSNEFLLSSLLRAQERPESLTELLALKAGMVDEITPAEVDAWAKKILPRRNSYTAAIVPKQFVGIFQADP